MKVVHKIPTVQYGNVEIHSEVTVDLTDDEIKERHYYLLDYFKPSDGEGLEQKEWNATVDSCLKGELKLTPDVWERMSKPQQWFLQEIKKSRNRK